MRDTRDFRERKGISRKEEKQQGSNIQWEQEITEKVLLAPPLPGSSRGNREDLKQPIITGIRAGAILIEKVTPGGRKVVGHPRGITLGAHLYTKDIYLCLYPKERSYREKIIGQEF